jgi:hypothetical protein
VTIVARAGASGCAHDPGDQAVVGKWSPVSLSYDAVVIPCAGADTDGTLFELLRSAERQRPADVFSSIVFAVAPSSDAALFAHIASLSGIIVSTRADSRTLTRKLVLSATRCDCR